MSEMPNNPSQQTRWAEDRDGQPDYPGQDRDVLAEALRTVVEAERTRHNAKGHSPGNKPFWCVEENGVTSTFCEPGMWLRAIAALAPDPGAAPEVEGLWDGQTAKMWCLDCDGEGSYSWNSGKGEPELRQCERCHGAGWFLAALRDTAPALDVERLAAFLHGNWEKRIGEVGEPGVPCPECTDDARRFIAEGASRDT